MEYEKLLKRAREKLPKSVLKAERFEMPRVRGHIQGNKTVISNFYQIADTLRREPEHLFKFVLKELATPGDLTKSAAIIGRKVPASSINEKIRAYADSNVICPECNRPDTKIEKRGTVSTMICLACGAHHPLKT